MAAGLLHSYSPKLIVFTFGATVVSGFADGTFVSLTELGDGTQSEAGADGEVARAMSTDPRIGIKITLQQTSFSNDELSWYYTADKESGGMSPQPIMLKDLRGTTLASGVGWIVKKPDSDYSKSIETREWEFEGVGKVHIGGSP